MIRTNRQVLRLHFEKNVNDANNICVGGTTTNITYIDGKFGMAANIATTPSYISIPHNAIMSTINTYNEITICCWAYHTSSNIGFLSAKENEHFEVHTALNNNIRFIPTLNTYIDTPAQSFPLNTWCHIACTYNSSNIGNIYINGAKQTVTQSRYDRRLSHIAIDVNKPWMVGARWNMQYQYSGIIDDFIVFNKELKEPDIKRIMLGLHPIAV